MGTVGLFVWGLYGQQCFNMYYTFSKAVFALEPEQSVSQLFYRVILPLSSNLT